VPHLGTSIPQRCVFFDASGARGTHTFELPSSEKRRSSPLVPQGMSPDVLGLCEQGRD
jgi:hypothetical protein